MHSFPFHLFLVIFQKTSFLFHSFYLRSIWISHPPPRCLTSSSFISAFPLHLRHSPSLHVFLLFSVHFYIHSYLLLILFSHSLSFILFLVFPPYFPSVSFHNFFFSSLSSAFFSFFFRASSCFSPSRFLPSLVDPRHYVSPWGQRRRPSGAIGLIAQSHPWPRISSRSFYLFYTLAHLSLLLLRLHFDFLQSVRWLGCNENELDVCGTAGIWIESERRESR